MLLVIRVSDQTRLVLLDDMPAYVLTVGKNFDSAMHSAESWYGQPLAMRNSTPWSPCRSDCQYISGFDPYQHFPADRDPWIVGVEEID